VTLLERASDHWWRGRSEQTGQVGNFPVAFFRRSRVSVANGGREQQLAGAVALRRCNCTENFIFLLSTRVKVVLKLNSKEDQLAEADDEDSRDSYVSERTLTLAAPGSQEKAPPRPPKAVTLELAATSRAPNSPALAMRATSNDDWCDSRARSCQSNVEDSLAPCLVSMLWTASFS
jgi:hypothetical protein